LRKLVVLPVAFALAMALVVPTAAFAAEEGLSNYNNKPTTSSSTPTPAPATGTSPSKESSTPTKTTAPETSSTEPSTTSEPTAKKASTLPFTGFDLRWTIGAGVILLAMGFSIVTVQRRQRRSER
jgi:hypothetical protein